jgi:hypothetical protein
MRGAVILISAIAFAGAAAADEFIVGRRGTESDYPFRGC